MVDKLKKFFSQIKWYEYVYMLFFVSVLIVIGAVFRSSTIVIFNSLFGIFTVFFIAKGKLIGNFFGIIQCILYAVISYFNNFFGEVIICLAISIPIYVVSIISWLRNQNKKDNVVKVNKNISLKEWVCSLLVLALVSVGVYFLLKTFNTANLLVSVMSVVTLMMAGYLVVRRSEYNFVFYILNNIICICLWLTLVIKNGEIGYLATVVQYVIFLTLNIVGVFNWIRIKKIQNMRKQILKRRQEMLIMDKDFMKEFE